VNGRKYQRRTSRVKYITLFIHPTTQKALSLNQLSTTISKLIPTAELSVKARIVYVCKYATSQSIIETISVSKIAKGQLEVAKYLLDRILQHRISSQHSTSATG